MYDALKVFFSTVPFVLPSYVSAEPERENLDPIVIEEPAEIPELKSLRSRGVIERLNPFPETSALDSDTHSPPGFSPYFTEGRKTVRSSDYKQLGPVWVNLPEGMIGYGSFFAAFGVGKRNIVELGFRF